MTARHGAPSYSLIAVVEEVVYASVEAQERLAPAQVSAEQKAAQGIGGELTAVVAAGVAESGVRKLQADLPVAVLHKGVGSELVSGYVDELLAVQRLFSHAYLGIDRAYISIIGFRLPAVSATLVLPLDLLFKATTAHTPEVAGRPVREVWVRQPDHPIRHIGIKAATAELEVVLGGLNRFMKGYFAAPAQLGL